jgi:hypothetical protein
MKAIALALLSLPLTGCIGVSVGTDNDEFFRVRGLGTAYAALPGIDDYDGKILKVGLLTRSPGGGQLAGVELWPLFKVGVGLVGAQVRVLPLELGAGVLFYHPTPVRRDLDADEERKEKAPAVEVDMTEATEPAADDVPIKKIESKR